MAIDITTLFTRLGRLIKYMNQFVVYQANNLFGTGAGGGVLDILSSYSARPDLTVGMEQQWQGQANNMASWDGAMVGVFTNTLADLQTVLNLSDTSSTTVLPALVAYMVANTNTVQACTIPTPTSTANGLNIGNGQLVLSKKNYEGVDDQRIITETVLLTCTADQFSGASAGAEQFSLVGWPTQDPNGYFTRGNGTGSNLTVADNSNLLVNGNFESFTANNPNSWTINNGTAGTNFLQNTNTYHTGAVGTVGSGSSLELVGNGSTATVGMSQLFNTKVSQQSNYLVGVWLRKGGTVTGGSNLQISLQGTGFTTVNLFNADPTTLTTSFAFYTAAIAITYPIPSDLRAVISWTTANASGGSSQIYIDDFVINAPVDFGHVQYAVFRGSADFLRTDSYTVQTSNNYAGVFQTAFGRWFNTQLPSVASGPSIADSLAQ